MALVPITMVELPRVVWRFRHGQVSIQGGGPR
jgi:hypothetical protein